MYSQSREIEVSSFPNVYFLCGGEHSISFHHNPNLVPSDFHLFSICEENWHRVRHCVVVDILVMEKKLKQQQIGVRWYGIMHFIISEFSHSGCGLWSRDDRIHSLTYDSFPACFEIITNMAEFGVTARWKRYFIFLLFCDIKACAGKKTSELYVLYM